MWGGERFREAGGKEESGGDRERKIKERRGTGREGVGGDMQRGKPREGENASRNRGKEGPRE